MNGHGIAESESRAIAAILAAARRVGTPVVAVGANARLLAFDRPLGLNPPRATLDWDFAARCASWGDFDRLRDACLAAGFSRGDHEHEFVHAATGVKVDLVPFGGLESAGGRITWPSSGFVMNVRGLREASEAANAVEVGPPAGSVDVPPVPVLLALKLLAHADRGHRDDRDLRDLWHLVERYPTDEATPRAFEPPLDVLAQDEAFDFGHLGALLAGADVAGACRPETLDDVAAVLGELENPDSPQLRPLVGGFHEEAAERRQRRDVAEAFGWMLRALEVSRDTGGSSEDR